MWHFGGQRALRVMAFAWALVLCGQPSDLLASPADLSQENLSRLAMRSEPFGIVSAVLTEGGLREKWLGAAREIEDETLILMLCQEDRAHCESPSALQFLAIIDSGAVREGRARLGEINRAINLAIRPMSDLQSYGAIDVWSSPLATLAKGTGDCEDYAIAKYVALRVAGVPREDIRIVIVEDARQGVDHAVVTARLDGRWLVLDNRRLVMLEDAQIADYRAIFSIDSDGVRRYVDTPLGPIAKNQSLDAMVAATGSEQTNPGEIK